MVTGLLLLAVGVLVGMLVEGCRRGGTVDLKVRLALLEPRPDGEPAPIVVDRSPDGRTVLLTAQRPR